MQPIIDQICKPFGWLSEIGAEDFAIYVESLDGKVYLLYQGSLEDWQPWKVRSVCMFTYWFLLTTGALLPPVAITVEAINEMRSEVFAPPVAAPIPKPSVKVVGPEAFAIDPAEIKSFVGATRTQHAPPATSAIGYTEDGRLEVRPGASPRRVIDDRVNW
jgi:hypothetical protein